MNLTTLIESFERWRTSRLELLRRVDSLQEENARLRQKLAALQHAKDQAERQAEERRREKEALRARLNSQKKASESHEHILGQLGDKITELRAENDKLKRSKKK